MPRANALPRPPTLAEYLDEHPDISDMDRVELLADNAYESADPVIDSHLVRSAELLLDGWDDGSEPTGLLNLIRRPFETDLDRYDCAAYYLWSVELRQDDALKARFIAALSPELRAEKEAVRREIEECARRPHPLRVETVTSESESCAACADELPVGTETVVVTSAAEERDFPFRYCRACIQLVAACLAVTP